MSLPSPHRLLLPVVGLTLMPITAAIADEFSQDDAASDQVLPTVVVTAAAIETLQAPGVSLITHDDIARHPPALDISERIRTMPGVNLTGNSSSGQRGNNRQIDIRGMGPENTLILVDGKPVTSRNSVRFGWRGERDSRGDTSWVPPDMIDHIDVVRGPAAARYGSGAVGGVVDIVTRKAHDNLWHGSFTQYLNSPQHHSEGATQRSEFSLNGPLSDNVHLQLFGDYSHTDADARNINAGHQSERTGAYASTLPAGREGVEAKNINAQLIWQFTPHQSVTFEGGYGRQGNLYAGDTQNTNSNALVERMYGHETNRIYRQTVAVTHEGKWDDGVATRNYIQFERTRNTRLNEGLAGGTEGLFDPNNPTFLTSRLTDITAHSELTFPLNWGAPQTATVGAKVNQQRLHDPASVSQSTQEGGSVPGIASSDRSTDTQAQQVSLFAEDNIALTDRTTLTPGLRLDHHSVTGDTWGPSLNLSHILNDDFTLKLGITRAYKAPNLYQTNPNYLLYSRGQGCYAGSGGCYLQGNDNLSAETSINKEIGLEFRHDDYQAGITYFHNDYRNKIEAGYSPIGTSSTGTTDIYQWDNVPKAVVQGIEGNVTLPVTSTVMWSNNLTYMIENENKTTHDTLSVIPRFTLNSRLDWSATDALSLSGSLTWYGTQTPKKYNYKGEPATGSERQKRGPYALIGVSGTYKLTPHLKISSGIDNLFDKRLYREGNAQTTGNSSTGAYLYGAGAATYNEPGRTFFVSLSADF